MSRYKTLRTWSAFLIALGILSTVAAAFGVVAWAVAVEGFWETLAAVFIGAPFVLLLAAWPVALGQAMRALADIGDSLAFDESAPMTHASRF
jgi:hypothetical protein